MNIIGILIGILLTSLGLMFLFLYTNLLTLGYSLIEYVHFISKRFECLLFFIGLILIIFSMKGWIKNVLLLRLSTKFSRKRKLI